MKRSTRRIDRQRTSASCRGGARSARAVLRNHRHRTAAELGPSRVARPSAFGGNMDNKELRAGTTLYLPVFNEGALFFAGDGHAVQGDGEVCITALETSVTGTFRLTVRKDMEIKSPFAENADTSDVDRP